MLIITGISIPAGILAGSGAVFVFNRIPDAWFAGPGGDLPQELVSEQGQRIKSVPWKMVFSAFFSVSGIYMGMNDWHYAIPASAAIWFLLELGAGAYKYGAVSEKLVMFLGLTGIGLVPFQGDILTPFLGACAGTGAMLAIKIAERFLLGKKHTDISEIALCGAAGLITGPRGVCIIIIASACAAGIAAGWRMLRRRKRSERMMFMGTFVCFFSVIYMLLLFTVL